MVKREGQKFNQLNDEIETDCNDPSPAEIDVDNVSFIAQRCTVCGIKNKRAWGETPETCYHRTCSPVQRHWGGRENRDPVTGGGENYFTRILVLNGVLGTPRYPRRRRRQPHPSRPCRRRSRPRPGPGPITLPPTVPANVGLVLGLNGTCVFESYF